MTLYLQSLSIQTLSIGVRFAYVALLELFGRPACTLTLLVEERHER